MSADAHSGGPVLFVILGGSGDLAQRKLFPVLFDLFAGEESGPRCVVLGVGTKDIGDAGLREKTRRSLVAAAKDAAAAGRFAEERLFYKALASTSQGYASLAARIVEIERSAGLGGNRVFYLATPPAFFPEAIRGLGESGLARSPGWVRLVVEKPFGRDLVSARVLDALIHEHFDESQVFRIDHYLGKETVRNLLVFRFANMIFESLWNRDKIEAVEITVAEDEGIETRARYYETAGALRDIVQNHLAQVLTLVAMEAPAAFSADCIRDEKVKVLRSIAGIEKRSVVRGQYGPGRIGGEAVAGYLEEAGVAPASMTETYVALKLHIDNWRWQGVPFLLRTGKRLARRLTRIVVTFREPPVCVFGAFRSCRLNPNRLVITLQPGEGFHLMFEIKEPGEVMTMRTERLHFDYADVFGPLRDAYYTLIRDVLEGDQTLFVRSDEVDAAWGLFSPLLEEPGPVFKYPAGTWGPPEADALPAEEGLSWSSPPEV